MLPRRRHGPLFSYDLPLSAAAAARLSARRQVGNADGELDGGSFTGRTRAHVDDMCEGIVIAEAITDAAEHAFDDVDVVLPGIQITHTRDVAHAMPHRPGRLY